MKKYIGLFCLLILGCSSHDTKRQHVGVKKNELKYAKGFSMEQRDGKTYIEVYNPWNNYSLLASYVLSGDSLNTDKNVIHVPVERAVCLSSTYIGMVTLLDARDVVVASSNANWICDSLLFQKFLDNQITNLGNDMSMSAEAVIAQQPDAVLKYIYQSPDPIDAIITNAAIPVYYLIEFMEEHPLGRAEWIKLVGALVHKQELADSIFAQIESNYLNYSELAVQSLNKPSVLDGSIYKGTWYAAGGNSFIARLFLDAHADYFWHSDSITGSLPLSFEVVIQNQKQADFWINANAFTLNEVLSVDSRCAVFKAFQEGNVYHYNKRVNINGGLDYFETGVVRPDLLLRDLLVILHPGIIDAETVYYKKLGNAEEQE
jgi:iron complex transport system substrate-binding protein